MRFLAAWLVLAAAVPGCLARGDLFCSCRLDYQRDSSLGLHCYRNQEARLGASCQKETVREIPTGYVFVRGYALLKLYLLARPWAKAKAFCEAEGTRLAVPPGDYAVDGITKVYPKNESFKGAYLGISEDGYVGLYDLDGNRPPYLNVAIKPENDPAVKHCIVLGPTGQMEYEKCRSWRPFLCERTLTVGVPDTYHWMSEAKRFYKVHQLVRQTYAQAVYTCRSENATLAVPDTYRKVELLLPLFEERIYYVGFTDQIVEGDFVTERGKHLKTMEFQELENSVPNAGSNDQDCLALTADGSYIDLQCTEEVFFICEIEPK